MCMIIKQAAGVYILVCISYQWMIKSFRLNTGLSKQSISFVQIYVYTSWNINQIVNVLKLLFPLSRRTVQKHWQCEMKQIMNAEVTSLHLASRAMEPTVRSSCSWLLCPTKAFHQIQQIQDANAANAGCKYGQCGMQIQQIYHCFAMYDFCIRGTVGVPLTCHEQELL